MARLKRTIRLAISSFFLACGVEWLRHAKGRNIYGERLSPSQITPTDKQ